MSKLRPPSLYPQVSRSFVSVPLYCDPSTVVAAPAALLNVSQCALIAAGKKFPSFSGTVIFS